MNETNNSKKILEVHNPNSNTAYIDISSPIQMTLEYCSGLSDDDFINIFMFSLGQNSYHKINKNSALSKFNSRELHRHNFFELMIILEGDVIQQIEGNDYHYSTGSCCIINRNIKHREKFYDKAKILFIGMSSEFILQLISEQENFYHHDNQPDNNFVFNFLKENILSDEQKNYLDIFPSFKNKNSMEELHDISEELIHLILSTSFGTIYGIKYNICKLFSYLNNKELFHATPVSLHTSADLFLFSRINHLLEDTNGSLNRKELSQLLNYSGNYINTVVKRYSGMCLFDYSLTYSLKKAAKLLESTDIPISSIAQSLNFTNRTHFYNLFKEKYGMTPGEYRKLRYK